MSDKANLSNAELELTQRIQMHFPRGVLSAEILRQWNGCPAEIITAAIAKAFGASIELHKADPRFTFLRSFQFTVPENYDHTSQLTSFAKENYEKFLFYESNIKDKNFSEVAHKLISGKIYDARLFRITQQRMSSEECLAFLKTQKAFLVGAQGISVAWQQANRHFPIGKRIASFVQTDPVWRDASDNLHGGVPSIIQHLNGRWSFDVNRFETNWDYDCCVFCVCDPK